MSKQVPKFFPKQTFANLGAAMHPIVQFLTNNHASIPGPGWLIIEAYDGTDREVPGDPEDLDSFTSGFGWRNDVASVPTGAWIVLESVRAAGNQCQIYLEYENTTTVHVLLMTEGDWATGAGTPTNPTVPDRTLGSSGSSFATSVSQALDLTGFTSSADYTIVADLSVVVFLFDAGGSSVNWTYLGELDNPRPTDDRPYVMWYQDGQVAFDADFTSFSCADALNGQFSACDGLHMSATSAAGDTIFDDDASSNFLGTRKIMPVGVHQRVGPSAGTKGWLRHVWSGENNAGASVTLDGRGFFGRNEFNDTHGQLVFAWDRTTA